MGKLYVLTRSDLSFPQQAVQSGHTVAQWMLENEGHEWRNETLIYLVVQNESRLLMWCEKLRRKGFKFSTFREPDIGNLLTGIACYSENENVFKNLKLMGQ